MNENWHKRLNRLSVGRAGSLTIIEGLVMDAILRFNLVIKLDHRSQPSDSPSRLFRLKTEGSHHLFLLNHILHQRQKLTGIFEPHFLNINPEHKIGLASRDNTTVSSRIKFDKTVKDIVKEAGGNGEMEFEVVDHADDNVDGNGDEIFFTLTSGTPTVDPLSNYIDSGSSVAVGKRKVGFHDEMEYMENPLESLAHNVQIFDDGTNPSTCVLLPTSISQTVSVSVESIPVTVPSISSLGEPAAPNAFVPQILSPPPLPSSSAHPAPSLEEHISEADESGKSSKSFNEDGTHRIEDIEMKTCEDTCVNYTETSDMSLIPVSPLPNIFSPSSVPSIASGSSQVVATSSALSIANRSRTAASYFNHTGKDISTDLLKNTFRTQSNGYWRFCALRLQDRWISTMSDMDWTMACKRYNDPTTIIAPQYYRYNFPYDPVHRDPISLKKMCIEFEASCRKWKTLLDVGRGSEVNTWKQMHLELRIPERPTSISREGRQTKLKICRRCCKVKDGMGKGKGHLRDKCDDGFPIWKAVPYPLPASLAIFRNSQPVISPEACLARFKELMKELDCAQGNLSALSQEFQNLHTFEKLARRDQTKSFQEALMVGKSAYNFSPEQFLRKSF